MGDEAPFATYRARAILGIVLALTTTSTLSVILRFMGKRINRTKVTLEDWFIIAAQVAVYALAAILILGRHVAEAPSKVRFALRLLIAVQVLHALSLGLIKTSIIFFYNRIFRFRTFRIASYIVIGLTFAWTAAAIVYGFLACVPLSSFWSPSLAESSASCVKNLVVPRIVIGAFDVAIDVAIIVLPLPFLWKLKVPLAEKIALVCIFGAGIWTMGISILRICALDKVDFSDVSYTGAYALIWSFAGPAIGISVACAPFFRPIFGSTRRKSDIEVGPYSTHFRRIREGTQELELQALQVSPNHRVGKGQGKHGSYIFTQVLESGNWSAASQHDDSGG